VIDLAMPIEFSRDFPPKSRAALNHEAPLAFDDDACDTPTAYAADGA
jgi:hypothetical protein